MAPQSRMEVAISRFFVELNCMAFDKAKELLESEKDAFRYSPIWQSLANLLGTFAYAEKAYYSLQFNGGSVKWAMRNFAKETIKGVYASCRSELCEKVAVQFEKKGLAAIGIDANFEDIITNAILPYLSQLCQIRIKLIAFYESFAVNVTNCNQIDHRCECLTTIKALSSDFKSTSSSMSSMNSLSAIPKAQVLKPLMNLVREELDVFMHLLSAELKIREFKYFDSLLDLHSASSVVKKWSNYSFSEGRFFAKRQPFAMVTWFTKLYEGLSAKFTFYFHTVLLANAPPSSSNLGRSNERQNDLRPFAIKSLDIHAKIMAFQKKNPGFSIGLVSSMLYPSPNGSDKVPTLKGASQQAINNAWGYALPTSTNFDILDADPETLKSFGSHHHLHRVSQTIHAKSKKKQRSRMVLIYSFPPQTASSVGSSVWWTGICQPIHSLVSECGQEIDIREKPVSFSVQTSVVPNRRQLSRGRSSKISETDSFERLSDSGCRSKSDVRTGSIGRNVLQSQICGVHAQAIDSDRCTFVLAVTNNTKIFSCGPDSEKSGTATSTVECLANVTAPSSHSLQTVGSSSPSYITKDSPANSLFSEIVPMLRLERPFGMLKTIIK